MQVDSTRAIIALSGEDRIAFLQGLLTQDMNALREDRGLFAALLSPQGKILHDMFLLAHDDSVLMDVTADQKDALLKRLNMYKLRAKVTLADVSDQWQIAYRQRADHATIGHVTRKPKKCIMTDPRAAEMGARLYLQHGLEERPKQTFTMEQYHLHRLRLGIPDSADIHDDVALDAGYDALNAISFSKGCYVGQEVTARMHYKQINRRGFYTLEAPSALPAFGHAIMAGDVDAGELRSHCGSIGLAMLKFEVIERAVQQGTPITVHNLKLTIHAPAWLHPKLAQFRAAHEKQ